MAEVIHSLWEKEGIPHEPTRNIHIHPKAIPHPSRHHQQIRIPRHHLQKPKNRRTLCHLLPTSRKNNFHGSSGRAGHDRQQTVRQKKKDWWATDVKLEFDKLKAENPDVIGWIRFDNQDELGINYPIRYSGDNQKYLRTDLHGNSHIAGCIFLEGLNKSDFSDYYNIIYGHNMNDGSMFGSLKKYKDDGFWKKNQYFTVYSETTAYRYRIFSYEDAVNGGDVYKVGYQPGEEYQKFIDQMIKDSDVDTGVKPQTSNKILTLSTCTGNGYSKRLAIHAVCVDAQTTDESKLKETGN